jgi:D-alanyl-lipoteichoic acid acyltransferase DltB (MBOAT superfamily)
LGGSKGSKWEQVRNVFVIFLLSGFWHGANWTFIAWGFINALYFLPLLLLNKNRSNIETVALAWDFSSLKVFLSILSTFSLSCLAWIFFRAKSISDAFDYIARIFLDRKFVPQYLENERYSYEILLLIFIFILVEWNTRTKIEPISGRYSVLKVALCIAAIIALGTYSDYKEFIYFQF